MDERLPRELRAFRALAHVVAAAPFRTADVLERICGEVCATFGFERALLVRLRGDRAVHAVVQQGIEWPGDAWLPIRDFPFLERAEREQRAVIVHDARAERAAPEAVIERFGVQSVAAAPLAADSRCVGFLVGDRNGRDLDLEETDLELLTALASVAAAFIDQADEYARLETSFDELHRLDQARHDFVSVASHELRTPIGVLHGVASTLYLRGDALEDEQLRSLRQTLFEQTTRLRDLAEQLLDLSRIDAGAAAITVERFRPRERIDVLLPQLAPDRLDDVAVEVDPTIEVATDPHAFERVISNLITNALCYGEPPVTVDCSSNGRCRLVVEDRGPGVDPEFVPRLFERFARSDCSRRRHQLGAGLGLAIARSYAEALGGDLRYERAQPTGARFVFELPS